MYCTCTCTVHVPLNVVYLYPAVWTAAYIICMLDVRSSDQTTRTLLSCTCFPYQSTNNHAFVSPRTSQSAMESSFQSTATLPSLAFTTLIFVVSVIVGPILGMSRKLPTSDRLVIVWLVYDMLTHFIVEGVFVYYSLVGTVLTADGFLADLWKEYARADARWGVSEPNVVSLEILTVVLDGILAVVLVYAILANKHYRHYVQIVLCVCELYGGWMTFCPEWITGSPNLDTSNFLFLWVYLVFFNGIWVVVPGALMCQSWVALRDQHAMVTTFQSRAQAQAKKK